MAEIVLEKATIKELDFVRSLDSAVSGSTSHGEFLTDAINADRCMIARVNDVPVGFGVLDRSFYEQNFISLLVVHPDYRRRGIARAIIRYFESLCTGEKLFTSTNESNLTAQKVFETLGFVRSGYIENLDEGDPEIIYFKLVSG